MSFSPLDSALTGPLFASAPMRAVFSGHATLKAMLDAEAALARALARHGLAPDGLASAIEGIEASSLDLVQLGEAAALAGVPVIPFVEMVRKRLPPALELSFHRGATSQDIADTALVLQAREGARLVLADCDAVLDSLAALARRTRDVPCAGRTYGQHAAPVTFGYKAAVWAVNIAEAARPWCDLAPQVLVASLGGPVGTLAALGEKGPAVAEAFANALGLGAAPVAWHVRRVGLFQLAGWLAGLAGALGKMANDIAYLSSTEIGEVAEPHQAGRGGSSSMPHKRNPVSSAVIAAAALAAKGYLMVALDSVAGAAQERPAGAWHAEWHASAPLFGLLSGALREARTLASGLAVDPARMRANLDLTRGLIFADAAANRLTEAMGREAAHRAVEHAADSARTKDIDLREALAGDAAIAAALGPAGIDTVFDLGPSVAAAALWTDRALASVAETRARLAVARGARTRGAGAASAG